MMRIYKTNVAEYVDESEFNGIEKQELRRISKRFSVTTMTIL